MNIDTTISLGSIITIITVIVALVTFHVSNVKRIQKAAAEFQDIKTKLDLMFDWFKRHVMNGENE